MSSKEHGAGTPRNIRRAGVTLIELLALILSKVSNLTEDSESLKLFCCRLKDAGLQRVSQFRQLREIEVAAARITDAGLVHFRTMKNPTTLDIGGNRIAKVTGKGVAQLHNLQNLTQLKVSSRVSDRAMRDLRRALPHCEVTRW